MVSGKHKLYQVTLPPKKNPGLDSFPHFPIIPHQPLKSQTLMDLPVLVLPFYFKKVDKDWH